MNKIVCLLPIYNNDNCSFFIQSVYSILNQSVKSDIVLLCDGEINGQLANSIKELGEKIKIIAFPQNRGLAIVLNNGLKYCFEHGYEYIARMDADDISLPERFEKQLKFLEENIDIDVVGGAIEEIDEKGTSRNKIVYYPLTHDECYRFFAKRDPLAHPAVMFRKSFFEKAGLYNELYRKNQDSQLWFAGFKNGCKFANLNEIILKFRINENFFNNRRAGYSRAKMMLRDRYIINKELEYGLKGNIYAVCMFFITIAPSFFRKIAYKILR